MSNRVRSGALAAPDRSVPVSARRENAAWNTFARHAIQQVLGVHRGREGRIVVDNMHAPLHRSISQAIAA